MFRQLGSSVAERNKSQVISAPVSSSSTFIKFCSLFCGCVLFGSFILKYKLHQIIQFFHYCIPLYFLLISSSLELLSLHSVSFLHSPLKILDGELSPIYSAGSSTYCCLASIGQLDSLSKRWFFLWKCVQSMHHRF